MALREEVADHLRRNMDRTLGFRTLQPDKLSEEDRQHWLEKADRILALVEKHQHSKAQEPDAVKAEPVKAGFWEYDERGVAWWVSGKTPIEGPTACDMLERDAVQAEEEGRAGE